MPTSNINHVVLTGRLTSDPDLRTLPSGSSVCHLRIAVNGRRRDPSGEWVEKPNFFDVTVFGGPGKNVGRSTGAWTGGRGRCPTVATPRR
jgi:single-strand DNA-binding protein